MNAKILCDVRCYDLARHFLQDQKHTEQDLDDLAGEIQETVETYMNAFETNALKEKT